MATTPLEIWKQADEKWKENQNRLIKFECLIAKTNKQLKKRTSKWNEMKSSKNKRKAAVHQLNVKIAKMLLIKDDERAI